MSDRFRTRIRTKRCPRCESLQDEANWVCDQCGYPEDRSACMECGLSASECTCAETHNANHQ